MKERILALVEEFEEIKKIREGRAFRNLHTKECSLRERIKEGLRFIRTDEELKELLDSCKNQNVYELLAAIMMEVKGPVRILEIENNVLTIERVLSGEW